MTYTASDLPPGLSMATDGTISGAAESPATEGAVYNTVVTASNECGAITVDVQFTIGTEVADGGPSFGFLHSGS